MKTILRHHFQAFSPLLWWTMLLDGNHQQQGPQCFEGTEPGYLRSMFDGLNFVLGTLGKRVTPELYESLHSRAIGHTHYRQRVLTATGETTLFSPFTKGFRKNTGTEFGLVTSTKDANCSEAGFVELLEQLERGDSYFYIKVTSIEDDSLSESYSSTSNNIPATKEGKQQLFQRLIASSRLALSIPVCSAEVLQKRIQDTFDRYYDAIECATSEDKRIHAVAVCIHELEVTHSYYDGNGRSNMLLLMLKVLLENNLSPAILFYADRFDTFSIGELCNEIKMGQHLFEGLHLPEEKPEGAILFLEGNETLMHLFAYQIAASVAVWHDIDKESQERCVTLIHKAIQVSKNKTLTYDDIETLMEKVERHLTSARSSLNPVTVDIGLFRAGLHAEGLIPTASEPSVLGQVLVWAANRIAYCVTPTIDDKAADASTSTKLRA